MIILVDSVHKCGLNLAHADLGIQASNLVTGTDGLDDRTGAAPSIANISAIVALIREVVIFSFVGRILPTVLVNLGGVLLSCSIFVCYAQFRV
jgi:hypothetical protein